MYNIAWRGVYMISWIRISPEARPHIIMPFQLSISSAVRRFSARMIRTAHISRTFSKIYPHVCKSRRCVQQAAEHSNAESQANEYSPTHFLTNNNPTLSPCLLVLIDPSDCLIHNTSTHLNPSAPSRYIPLQLPHPTTIPATPASP
jgi:hypothetical protein